LLHAVFQQQSEVAFAVLRFEHIGTQLRFDQTTGELIGPHRKDEWCGLVCIHAAIKTF